MPYPAELTLLIVVTVIAAGFLATLFFYGPIKRWLYAHMTVRMYYSKVKRIAEDHDYYLINNFKSRTNDDESFHIDHLLVGNKYIYCIRDRYYPGALSAQPDDKSWIYYKRKNAQYIDNPMLKNVVRTERLALVSGISRNIFISIVVINDDCYLSPFDNQQKDSYLISLKTLPALIAQLESEDVPALDEWEVERVVADFAELKRNG
ncbi:MAG: NERD domain-containing protein [Bacilli bacterium]|nr:NERD domain-containing protein [Bacilli bacterium]